MSITVSNDILDHDGFFEVIKKKKLVKKSVKTTTQCQAYGCTRQANIVKMRSYCKYHKDIEQFYRDKVHMTNDQIEKTFDIVRYTDPIRMFSYHFNKYTTNELINTYDILKTNLHYREKEEEVLGLSTKAGHEKRKIKIMKAIECIDDIIKYRHSICSSK